MNKNAEGGPWWEVVGKRGVLSRQRRLRPGVPSFVRPLPAFLPRGAAGPDVSRWPGADSGFFMLRWAKPDCCRLICFGDDGFVPPLFQNVHSDSACFFFFPSADSPLKDGGGVLSFSFIYFLTGNFFFSEEAKTGSEPAPI